MASEHLAAALLRSVTVRFPQSECMFTAARAAMLSSALLVAACIPSAPSMAGPPPAAVAQPTPATAQVSGPSAAPSGRAAPLVGGSDHDTPLARESFDAPETPASLAAAPPLAAAATPAATPPRPHGYAFEVPSLPGPVFTDDQVERSSPMLLSHEAEVAARWNLGGSSREDDPSRNPGSHPGTRVVVDATLAGVFGPTAKRAEVSKRVQARVRARGYWPLRACYEASWRTGLDEPTDDTIRATLVGSGRVQATRTLKHDGPAELGPCLREALAGLDLGPLPARRIDADFRIRFWPGDAPLPRNAQPRDDSCVDAEAAAPLERAEQAWKGSTRELNACVEPALARDSKLWGRLALRARFDPNGQAVEVSESQTTFPDEALVGCVTRIVHRLQLGSNPCPADLVFALRVGDPEPDATGEPTQADKRGSDDDGSRRTR